MCGLVTVFHPKENIDNNIIVEMFNLQRHRGTRGFGFTYLTKSGRLRTMRFTTESEAFFTLSRVRSKLVQFHHRLPTSTENVAFQNHPICTESVDGRYFSLTHNGVIHNAEMLRRDDHKDIEFSTEESSSATTAKKKFNDSECLLHELVRRAVDPEHRIQAEGSIAFILLEGDSQRRLTKLHYGRNYGNPLFHEVDEDTGVHIISSENGFLTEKEKDDCNVTPHTINTIEFNNDKIRRKKPVGCLFPSATRRQRREDGKILDENTNTWVLPAGDTDERLAKPNAANVSANTTPYIKSTPVWQSNNNRYQRHTPHCGNHVGFHKKEKEEDTLNAHQKYLVYLEYGEEMIMEIQSLDPEEMDTSERHKILKDLDELVRDMQHRDATQGRKKIPRRIQDVIDEAQEQRRRFLPPHTGVIKKAISLVSRSNVLQSAFTENGQPKKDDETIKKIEKDIERLEEDEKVEVHIVGHGKKKESLAIMKKLEDPRPDTDDWLNMQIERMEQEQFGVY